jgi:hypothetical protein
MKESKCFSAVVFHFEGAKECNTNPILTTWANTSEELDANLQEELSKYAEDQIGKLVAKFTFKIARETDTLDNYGCTFVIHRFVNGEYYDRNTYHCFPYCQEQEKLVLPT